jgi:uncharacterized protein (TIGR03382 family)
VRSRARTLRYQATDDRGRPTLPTAAGAGILLAAVVAGVVLLVRHRHGRG